MRASNVRHAAVVALASVHVLGMAGAPFAANLHVFQPGASAHQNFHVVWEAFKYFAASALAFAITVGPFARGEAWARAALLVASIALFGGVFMADAITGGAPAIDHWSYGTFLVVSLLALVTEAVTSRTRTQPKTAAQRAASTAKA